MHFPQQQQLPQQQHQQHQHPQHQHPQHQPLQHQPLPHQPQQYQPQQHHQPHQRHQPHHQQHQQYQLQHQILLNPQIQQQQQFGMNTLGMMDAVAQASNPRASRNMAEKQRRDNLNTQIATMASLVPTVSTGGSRKKDKISVLRLTAAHLRVAYTLGIPTKKFLPSRFNDINLENCLVDNLSGNTSFLLVVTTTGKIIYISRHVEQHLGHEQIDLIGDSLYNYIYHEDHEELTRGLTPDDSFMVRPSATTGSDSLEESSNSSEDSTIRPEYSNFKPERRSFNIRMSQRANSRRETVQYEYILVSGILRLAHECRNRDRSKTGEHNTTSNDIIFVGTARLLKKRTITELSILEANKNEYFTRHLVDGRIIFCDHRISIIAGYMSEEVSGSSAFKFMHKEDVRWTIVALRDMYDHGKNYGSSCYRLMTKTGEYIYLRTHGYLEFDETSNSVCSFICINTLTTPEEGEELIADMKTRFSAIVNSCISRRGKKFRDDGFESESESSSHGTGSFDDSCQLEEAVAHLLGDLPQPVIEGRKTPVILPNSQLIKAAIYSKRLPPAVIHANKVGIKDMENAYASYGKGGKNGKGKQSAAAKKDLESKTDVPKNNGNSVKPFGEKRMPELDDSSNPATTPSKRTFVPIAEKVVPSVNEDSELNSNLQVVATLELPPVVKSDPITPPTILSPFDMNPIVEDYNKGSIQADGDLPPPSLQQQPRQQTNLKRPYEHPEDTNDINSKKIARSNGDNVVNDPDTPYVPAQSMALVKDLQEVPSHFKQLDANAISIALTEDQYIDFQDIPDDQLLNSAIENNPAIIKLFSNLPPTINLDEIVENENDDQYPNSDGAVVENEVRRAHSQLADSVSSCESQYSDIEEPNMPTKCESFAQAHNDRKIQKQQLSGLQRNLPHDIDF